LVVRANLRVFRSLFMMTAAEGTFSWLSLEIFRIKMGMGMRAGVRVRVRMRMRAVMTIRSFFKIFRVEMRMGVGMGMGVRMRMRVRVGTIMMSSMEILRMRVRMVVTMVSSMEVMWRTMMIPVSHLMISFVREVISSFFKNFFLKAILIVFFSKGSFVVLFS
jgi:hypothetical protein